MKKPDSLETAALVLRLLSALAGLLGIALLLFLLIKSSY